MGLSSNRPCVVSGLNVPPLRASSFVSPFHLEFNSHAVPREMVSISSVAQRDPRVSATEFDELRVPLLMSRAPAFRYNDPQGQPACHQSPCRTARRCFPSTRAWLAKRGSARTTNTSWRRQRHGLRSATISSMRVGRSQIRTSSVGRMVRTDNPHQRMFLALSSGPSSYGFIIRCSLQSENRSGRAVRGKRLKILETKTLQGLSPPLKMGSW